MALHLIHGPPNSGRAGLVRRRFTEAVDDRPVLVVPTVDDVYAFERELCQAGATLGSEVMAFERLFRAVRASDGSPPSAELTPTQRLRAIATAIAERRGKLGPLRHSAGHPGFAIAFERLLTELQESGLAPEAVEASAQTLDGSVYLGDLANLFAGYIEVRERTGRIDSHVIAREAIALLRRSGESWGKRPVFLYGLDDLTRNQFELIEALAATTTVTVALSHEAGNIALEARASLLEKLEGIGIASDTPTEPDPSNTPEAPLLFHLERGFATGEAEQERPKGDGLVILRSAGERGEAEAIATEVATLLDAGADPAEIAIALRDPRRRGAQLASVLESSGIGTALEAELPVSATSVGGTLIALLQTEFGTKRAADLLRFLRGPSRATPRQVDWLEQRLRRGRVQSAAAALELWRENEGGLPEDLLRVRRAASESPLKLAREVAHLAATMASRPLRSGEDGPTPGPGEGLELRAAAAISGAFTDIVELKELAPSPEELIAAIEGIEFRGWSGPVEGRVRIANPYRLRAARFDHLIVASLQDGEFPRHGDRDDPFLGDAQRALLGLEKRRDTQAEERYLFHACLALPRKQLFLSYRESDENGIAESPSPFLDDVRRLLGRPPEDGSSGPAEPLPVRGRPLSQVVDRVGEAPSENDLARAIAAHGPSANRAHLLEVAGVDGETARRVTARLELAQATEIASRAPGPLSNPATIDSLGAVAAHGGTTLELFDGCSYRWFTSHELNPQRLDPDPDALVQGGLMHEVLDRLFKERPGATSLPRLSSLAAWTERGQQLVAEVAAEREMGEHPTERAVIRRVEGLLARFLGEEAGRETGGFEPWLTEAKFGDEEGSERPALEIDGWRLHGAIDRVDRDSDGRALVIDYKLTTSVTPHVKLEEQAKLQLQLYMVAVAELWGAIPVGGLYHPLRGTSARRPRGVVLDEVGEELSSYILSKTDLVSPEELDALLADARKRASEIVSRMRRGDIRRDPGPALGLRNHNVCPSYCDFAPICRRDRAPEVEEPEEETDQ
jgi:ATP-dependent helicase/DNAse subunit B